MEKIKTLSRYVLGLIYFVFGLNGFFNFIPAPAAMPEAAMGFINGLMSSGYFFPFLKGTEVLGGALLLSGFAAPLALVVLAPITLNILLFHTILTPGIQNAIMPVAMLVLHLLAASKYCDLYRPLFTRRN